MALRNSVMEGGVMNSKEFSDLEGGSGRGIKLKFNISINQLSINQYINQSVDQSIKQQK